MRSDLNEFVTKYLALVGAAVMFVGFVGFVATANDGERGAAQTSALQVDTITAPQAPSTGS